MLRKRNMPLPEELYEGVFYVTQFTRGTVLENAVAVDRVRMAPWKDSTKHRHRDSETVLFIEQGFAIITIDDMKCIVKPGDRVPIPKGAWHNVLALQDEFIFTSIQCPPIHDEATGRHDLEVMEQENSGDAKITFFHTL